MAGISTMLRNAKVIVITYEPRCILLFYLICNANAAEAHCVGVRELGQQVDDSYAGPAQMLAS